MKHGRITRDFSERPNDEIDNIYRILNSLAIPAQDKPQSKPAAVQPVSAGIQVRETDGVPVYYGADGIEFDQSSGFVVSQTSDNLAKVQLTGVIGIPRWEFVYVNETSVVLVADPLKIYMVVIEDPISGSTVTLPDPEIHKGVPLFINCNGIGAPGSCVVNSFAGEAIGDYGPSITLWPPGYPSGTMSGIILTSDAAGQPGPGFQWESLGATWNP